MVTIVHDDFLPVVVPGASKPASDLENRIVSSWELVKTAGARSGKR
jgi:hypothetical protein